PQGGFFLVQAFQFLCNPQRFHPASHGRRAVSRLTAARHPVHVHSSNAAYFVVQLGAVPLDCPPLPADISTVFHHHLSLCQFHMPSSKFFCKDRLFPGRLHYFGFYLVHISHHPAQAFICHPLAVLGPSQELVVIRFRLRQQGRNVFPSAHAVHRLGRIAHHHIGGIAALGKDFFAVLRAERFARRENERLLQQRVAAFFQAFSRFGCSNRLPLDGVHLGSLVHSHRQCDNFLRIHSQHVAGRRHDAVAKHL